MARTASGEGGTVIVATLKRGKNYKHQFEGKYYAFNRNVPEEVSEALADELEQLVDRINTDDGDMVEKDYFEIDRDASPRVVSPENKRIRYRLTAEEVSDTPVRKKPALRKPPVVAPAPTGFGKRRTATG